MEQDAVSKIQQRLAELPADVQTAIQSSDLHAKVSAVGAKHQLHIDQVGELEDEVMLTMLGFAPLEGMGARLAQTLHLPTETGENLATDINVQLFTSIRESMKAFAAKKALAATPAPTPTMPAATTPAAPLSNAPAKPPIAPDMLKADVVLTQKTISTPAPTPPQTMPLSPKDAPITPSASTTPPIYKADPYREPIQ